MVLNNSGQVAFVGLMVGVFIFLLAIGLIEPISDVITEARNGSRLDCDNSSISDGKKLTCLAVDLILPYFIIILIAIAGGWITMRIF
jgi:hypothetical protein